MNTLKHRSSTGFAAGLSVVILLLTPDCTYFQTRQEMIPVWPAGGLPATGGGDPDYWDLRWLDASGDVGHRRVPGGSDTLISCGREKPLVISAVPVIGGPSGEIRFRPAGRLSADAGAEGSHPVLSWTAGFSASLILDLAASGVDPARLNLRRFAEAVEERSGGDPWLLDIRRLISDLTAGDLWIYSFRTVDTLEVSLRLPAGLWYSEYPPMPPVRSVGELLDLTLPPGLHRFCSEMTLESLTVAVDERGNAAVFSDF